MKRLIITLTAAFGLTLGSSSPAFAESEPTCSSTLGIAVHGQHVLGDYLTGEGRANQAWPPSGGVGDALGGTGPAVVGGPGPGFHFVEGFAPGASFCNSQSQSPGFHAGG